MDQLFPNGAYRGEGRWIDQKTDGRYSAQYTIIDGPNGAKVHQVERVFFKPDGSVAYEEKSTVSFEPQARASLSVTISAAEGAVTGVGYAFDRECHYDVDIASDNHLEFTFHAEPARVHGVGSATNKGNRTYWRETLDRL
jgi:hypothetical protein